MKKNKLFRLLVAMFVVVFVLSACAPAADEPEAPADDTYVEENGDAGAVGFVQGVTDDAIYFANSAAASGGLAIVGVPFLAGMEAYREMINAQGGVHGRELRFVHTDDGFDPAQGVAALEGFIYDDEVFAIVGHFGTPVIAATFDTIVESGIPTVYFAAGTGVVYNENATDGNGRNTFPVQPVFPMEGRIFSAWAVGQFEAQTVGLIFTNDDAGRDFYQGVTGELATINEARATEGLDAIELVTAQVDPNAEDVTAAVATVLEADVDVVIAGMIQGTLPQTIRGLAAQGNTVPVITSYVNADVTMTGLVADVLDGSFNVYASSWVDMTRPELADFQEWVAQVSDEDLTFNAFAMTGWIAMHFFVEGLERAGRDVTWANFIEAMESAPIQNPFGPAIDFSNGNRVGTQDLALIRMAPDEVAGWEGFLDFMGIDDILGQ